LQRRRRLQLVCWHRPQAKSPSQNRHSRRATALHIKRAEEAAVLAIDQPFRRNLCWFWGSGQAQGGLSVQCYELVQASRRQAVCGLAHRNEGSKHRSHGDRAPDVGTEPKWRCSKHHMRTREPRATDRAGELWLTSHSEYWCCTSIIARSPREKSSHGQVGRRRGWRAPVCTPYRAASTQQAAQD
jgi:hypothetical protein